MQLVRVSRRAAWLSRAWVAHPSTRRGATHTSARPLPTLAIRLRLNRARLLVLPLVLASISSARLARRGERQGERQHNSSTAPQHCSSGTPLQGHRGLLGRGLLWRVLGARSRRCAHHHHRPHGESTRAQALQNGSSSATHGGDHSYKTIDFFFLVAVKHNLGQGGAGGCLRPPWRQTASLWRVGGA